MKWLCYCQQSILLTSDNRLPSGAQPPLPLQPWQTVTVLYEDNPARTCTIVRLDTPPAALKGYRMADLRHSYDLIPPDDYQLAGKGEELLFWDQCTRFCGVCGSPMEWQTSISKQCTQCGKEVWPSPSVAVIVRVLRGQEILLVRARNFRGRYYGLVAGFVETGESLEECVRRELWEETRIRVHNLRYFGSQPWPFPFGLMVGFTADYESGDIALQLSELAYGGWFDRQHLPQIPSKASIARRLIDDWLEKEDDHHNGNAHGNNER